MVRVLLNEVALRTLPLQTPAEKTCGLRPFRVMVLVPKLIPKPVRFLLPVRSTAGQPLHTVNAELTGASGTTAWKMRGALQKQLFKTAARAGWEIRASAFPFEGRIPRGAVSVEPRDLEGLEGVNFQELFARES